MDLKERIAGEMTEDEADGFALVGDPGCGDQRKLYYSKTRHPRSEAEMTRRKGWFYAIGVSGLLWAGAAAAAPGEMEQAAAWRNALQPAGPSVEVTLATAGRTDRVILVPARPSPQEQKAAEELAHWLHEITGAEFPVAAEGSRAAKREGPVLSVGNTRRLAEAGVAPATDLADEGYAIAVKDGDVFLLGGRLRGPIYAVMALLEEDLGCRWYTSRGNRIVRQPDLRAPIVPRAYAPRFALRDPFSFVSDNPDWSLRNRTNAYGATIPSEWGGNLNYAPGWFVHTYTHILASTDENLARCPECFMLDEDGRRSSRQLCPTHPEVIASAIAKVKAVLAAHPDAELVDVSQNDIRGYCHCDRCMALIRQEGTPAAPLLVLVNAVAAAVAEDHPAVRISTLGYQDTVPAPATMKPGPNVVIRLATDVMWRYPFTAAEDGKEFTAALNGWHRVAGQMHIWDYQVNFGDYFAPWPMFWPISRNLRLFADSGVTGVMTQGSYQGPGTERQLMRAWVFAKLLWDPSREVWPLMQDFIRGYFGPAAPPIEAYNRLLFGCGQQRQGVTECLGTERFLAEAKALYDQAETLAGNDPETRHRVELDRLPIQSMEIQRLRGLLMTDPASIDLPAYRGQVARFEEVASREKVTMYSEGIRLDAWLTKVRQAAADPEPAAEWVVDGGAGTISVYRLPALWQVHLDPARVGEQEHWFGAGAPDRGWTKYRTDLGVGWEEQGFPGADGDGWFRCELTVPASLDRPHRYLFFGACDEETWVWVDGEPAGERTVASTGVLPEFLWLQPFSLAADRVLAPGATRSLVIRVHDSGGMGGIYQPVFAVAADRPLTTAEIKSALKYRNPYTSE
ncbi:MAG: DUF4838 domain-containing protein [Candidatus Latescibacterota bacterium]|jgi:hypothetical protein